MLKHSNIIESEKHREKFINRLKGLMSEYMNNYGFKNIEGACASLDIPHQSYYAYIDNVPKKRKDKTKYYTYPNYENLYKLSNAFSVTSDYLMCMSDDKSPQEKEIDLTLQDICNKTGLSENVVSQLCYPHNLYISLRDFINYFFEINEKAIPLLKKHSTLDFQDYKGSLQLQTRILEIIGHDMKDNKNLLGNKRNFLKFAFLYVFEKIVSVQKFNDSEGDFEYVDHLYLSNEWSKMSGFNSHRFDVTPQYFDRFYLDTATDFLIRIKDNFQTNDYDKYHSIFLDVNTQPFNDSDFKEALKKVEKGVNEVKIKTKKIKEATKKNKKEK